ncbi:MAG: energy-coupling factor transporter transmembrane protein EcfT [Deltaproteobacteria bacterium]|nr:energy-coupling factor transporter transmembrane protein EcfT [Deltaproteobacteria bacterium]
MYNLGQYIPRKSLIHTLDPRIKILFVVMLSIIILNARVFTALVISVFLVFLLPLSRIHPQQILRSLRPVIPFLVLLFLLHLLLTEGVPLPPFPAWRITVTSAGLFRGIMVTWQFMLLIISASFLTMTTPPTGLVSGLERLLRPFRIIGVPSHDLAVMVSVALRFVPTFLEEIRSIREAQMSRGADLKTGSIYRRIRSTVSMMIPLISSTFRRADELATAMESRGYFGGSRTYMHDLCLTPRDYCAILMMLFIGGSCLFQDDLFHLLSLWAHV